MCALVTGVQTCALPISRALGAADLAAGLVAWRPALPVRLVARNEADIVGHIVVIGDDHAAHRIDRDAAPVGSAIIARIFDRAALARRRGVETLVARLLELDAARSEEHTSELQSLMRISYAVFCLKKKKKHQIRASTKFKLNEPTDITLTNTTKPTCMLQ